MAHNEQKYQELETNYGVIQMIELVHKGVKIIIIVFHMVKKVKESMRC